ncbi:Pao retrotransposon peptidase family protein, partial [Aphelenchoides avenae]
MDWDSQGEIVSINAGLSKSEGLAEIKDDLEKLWQWENIGIGDNPQVLDDDVALEQFQKSLRFINVVREEKATTKVRIVYDASAKGGPGTKSLNQCLYRGPVFLPDLAGMLLRFRIGKIVIAADIEKAFLQISLRESDRDVTRFLWLKDPSKGISDDNVVVYRFARIPFGVISSPFILAATIREHLKKEVSSLSEEIKQNIYSDNVLLFANSESEAIEKCRKAYQIFKRANMNLREFVSNNAAVNFAFGDHGKEFASKFLGVHWDPKADLLEYVIPVLEEDLLRAPTKRAVLQKLAKIFDPL